MPNNCQLADLTLIEDTRAACPAALAWSSSHNGIDIVELKTQEKYTKIEGDITKESI